MHTERNLNELKAEDSAELQWLCLLKPEPEPSAIRQIKAGQRSVKTNARMFSHFICSFVAIAAVLLALGLLWSPVAAVQSAAYSPALMDGEMAVIYRLENAQTDSCVQAGTTDSFATTRQSEIEWLQIVHKLSYQLKKALLINQLHRLVSLQKKSLYKLKYSALV